MTTKTTYTIEITTRHGEPLKYSELPLEVARDEFRIWRNFNVTVHVVVINEATGKPVRGLRYQARR